MEKDQYAQIASFERHNWWYRSRRDLLDRIISSQTRTFDSMLDAGCGVGSHCAVLLKHSRNVYGLDSSREAIDFCSKRGYTELFHSTITDMCLGKKFDLIVCMDVLEHVHDDRRAACILKEHLSEDGILVISVPAHMYLWNDNDVFSHHVRRYELKDLKELVRSSGLAAVKMGYWNQFGYLPCLIFYSLRRLNRKKRNLENNLRLIPEALNSVLCRVLRFENSIFMKRSLWQGVSIVGVCKHKAPAFITDPN